MTGMKRLGAAAMGAALVFATAHAQQEPGPIERAGERLDEAGRSVISGVERGLNRTREAVRESFEKSRVRINDMGVEARVYGRVHWDKMLESSTIDIAAEADGIVTLRGSVPSDEARTRAVELATDTVGVARVIDELAVQTTSQVVDPAATSSPRSRAVRQPAGRIASPDATPSPATPATTADPDSPATPRRPRPEGEIRLSEPVTPADPAEPGSGGLLPPPER
ncbi:BON domain-containing protein [Paludisphaera sp.]|uniref:BON domain-containing protein n=1 Tax=Paludisphaera sp. TaxID=2017432 RepID=UPI00301E245A